MSSSLKRLSVWTLHNFRMNTLMRSNFHKSCFVAQKRVVENRSLVEKEMQENKTIILTHLKDQNLSVSYGISEKISRLLSLFPFSQPAVKSAVIESPDLLRHDPQKIYDFTTVLVECSDYDGISQEDALCFVGEYDSMFKNSVSESILVTFSGDIFDTCYIKNCATCH